MLKSKKKSEKKTLKSGPGGPFYQTLFFTCFLIFVVMLEHLLQMKKKNLLHAIARLKSEKQINYPLTSTKSLVGLAPCVVVAKAEW